MLIRVRCNLGVWRVDNLDESTATVSDILEGIAQTRPHVQYTSPISSDPACLEPLDTTKTLAEMNLKHGSMVHCRVDPSTCAEIRPKSDDNNNNNNSSSNTTTNNDNTMDTTGVGSEPVQQQQQQQQQHMKRIIDKDGSIKLVPSGQDMESQQKGFRKGMMPLRDMKMAWTLNEFMALDSQFEFKIQRQKEAVSKQVSLDTTVVQDFQAYCAQFAFQRKRFGFLYGTYIPIDEEAAAKAAEQQKANESTESKPFKKKMDLSDLEETTASKIPMKAVVEAMYEPPQEYDSESAEGFVPLDDPNEETVEQLAQLLGLQKVGWIFSHPPREDGFVMSNAEIIMAAEFQLEAAQGVAETPFTTVKVTQGKDGNVSVEGFQVSQQCMAMVAEEALEIDADPKVCKVNDTFTAIQEGKPSPTVENNFFLTVVPITTHASSTFVATFPVANRDVLTDRKPSKAELKKQLAKSGTAGWTMIDLLSDFQLLVFLATLGDLDMNADMPTICQSVVNRDVPLSDGYKIVISGIAGLEGSY